MELVLAGGYGQGVSLDVLTSRTINWYAVHAAKTAKSPYASLMPTPGLRQVANLGPSRIRGMHVHAGRLVVAHGQTITVLDSAFQTVSTFTTPAFAAADTPVRMATNGTQLIMVNGATTGVKAMIYDGTSLVEVTDPDFVGSHGVQFMDGYFVTSRPGTGIVAISDLNDGLAYDATDVKTAEGLPDVVVAVLATDENLYVFGEDTTEVWYNAAIGAGFPFQRVSGGVVSYGCVARGSVAIADSKAVFLGRSRDGDAVVLAMSGNASPQIISSVAVSYAISSLTDQAEAMAMSYMIRGHFFYEITFPVSDRTFLYDFSTREWTELSSGANGGQHRTRHNASFGGRQLVGDAYTGIVYHLDPNYYLDGSSDIIRTRIFPALNKDNRFIAYDALRVWPTVTGMVTNPVTGGQDAPRIMLDWSSDRAREWSYEQTRSLPTHGSPNREVMFNRLGSDVDRTFRLRAVGNASIGIARVDIAHELMQGWS